MTPNFEHVRSMIHPPVRFSELQKCGNKTKTSVSSDDTCTLLLPYCIAETACWTMITSASSWFTTMSCFWMWTPCRTSCGTASAAVISRLLLTDHSLLMLDILLDSSWCYIRSICQKNKVQSAVRQLFSRYAAVTITKSCTVPPVGQCIHHSTAQHIPLTLSHFDASGFVRCFAQLGNSSTLIWLTLVSCFHLPQIK